MNDLLFACLILLPQVISLVLFVKYREKIFDLIGEAVESRLISWFSEEENQKAIMANVQNMVVSPTLESLKMALIGSKGGTQKGLNYALKDLAKEAIDSGAGMPGLGDLALGASIPRELKPFIPLILNQFMKAQGQGFLNPSSNPGGGNQVPNMS